MKYGKRRGPGLAERIVGNPNVAVREHYDTLMGQLKALHEPDTLREFRVYSTIQTATSIAEGKEERQLRQEYELPKSSAPRHRRTRGPRYSTKF